MKIINRLLGFLLNAAIMAVVVLVIKYQDDVVLEGQRHNFAIYSSLMRTNTTILESRTRKVSGLLARIEAAQNATSTPGLSKAASLKKSPTSAIRLPAPNPSLAPMKPNRTTKTS